MIDSAAAPQDSTTGTATVRRYAPPSQRNRVLSRRKSGDRFDRTNSNNNNNPIGGNEGGERTTQPASSSSSSSRNIPLLLGGSHEIGTSQHSYSHPGFISIHGCGRSVAAQLLTRRWAAAMHSYNDPSIDSSERPVMYSGSSASAWGHSRLSHQVDFMTELHRAVCSAKANADA